MVFCLLLILCLTWQQTDSVVDVEVEHGLIVVPGLGRPDRMLTVVENFKKLRLGQQEYTSVDERTGRSRPLVWKCIVYIYAPRTETVFWAMTSELKYLHDLCDVVENPNKRVAENMFMLQPALLKLTYSKVFLFLDDCQFVSSSPASDGSSKGGSGGRDAATYASGEGGGGWGLQNLVSIMQRNNLTIVSPMVQNSNKVGGNKFRNILHTEAQPGTEGYVSSFIEIFVWLMTLDAYQALWELLNPHVNPYAWGYDFWYDGYAKLKVKNHKMGIASRIVVSHVNGAEGRSDNTSVKLKWNSVLAQERHYRNHLGVNLNRMRNKLDITSDSWKGAVKGYLY